MSPITQHIFCVALGVVLLSSLANAASVVSPGFFWKGQKSDTGINYVNEPSSLSHFLSQATGSDLTVGFLIPELTSVQVSKATGAFAADPVSASQIPFLNNLSQKAANVFTNVDVQNAPAKFSEMGNEKGTAKVCINVSSDVDSADSLNCVSSAVAIAELQSVIQSREINTVLIYLSHPMSSDTAGHIQNSLELVSGLFDSAAGRKVAYFLTASAAQVSSKVVTFEEVVSEERRLQIIIILLIQSNPMIISGLLVSLFMLLFVIFIFSTLGSIQVPTRFFTRYPYQGKVFE